MGLIHTCYRIMDIDRSVAFYRALGFEEKGRLPIRRRGAPATDRGSRGAEQAGERASAAGERASAAGERASAAGELEAINVFMGLPDDGPEPRLELTYNIGREEPYEIGTGYGHIAITTPDLDGTLERLSAQGIEPERPPYTVSEGGSRLCFVRDPDGYRIELIERRATG